MTYLVEGNNVVPDSCGVQICNCNYQNCIGYTGCGMRCDQLCGAQTCTARIDPMKQ